MIFSHFSSILRFRLTLPAPNTLFCMIVIRKNRAKKGIPFSNLLQFIHIRKGAQATVLGSIKAVRRL